MAPALLVSFVTAGPAYDVFVAGNTAYVACDASGLHIIDVTDPTAPTLLGSYDAKGDV